jgi:hypothetical protein
MLTSYSRSKLTLTTEHQVGNPQRTPPQLKQAIALDWEKAIAFSSPETIIMRKLIFLMCCREDLFCRYS